MTVSKALAGAALVACAGSVCAQSISPPPDPIVVTATRTARTADETLASVSVITREDIERRQSQDVVDLLRTQAGIDITRSGGPGGNVSLFMRGANSNHVLVLIDGVRVASAGTGTFDWRSLPLTQVERIEIVRGPRASLYGSDAIGGVIQIFTRRPQGLEAAVGAGSAETRRAHMAWGTRGRTRIFVTGSHFETEGFSATNERAFSFDPDADGARRQAVSAGIEADLDGGARLDVVGRQARGTAEFDRGESDIVNESLSARLLYPTSDGWTQSLSLGLFGDELLTRGDFPSAIRSRRRSLEWQNDVVLSPDSFVTAGLSYLKESAVNATVFDAEQDSRAGFALWQRRFGTKDIQLAGRYDDYSTFGGHGTWSAAYGWELARDTRAWISYGTGFRAPSLNDLFHPGVFGGLFAGNPDLQPERSRTTEVGIRQTLPAGRFALSLFSTRFENLIAFQGVNFQAINIERASARGVELEHARQIGHWYLSTAITLQRARNETTDEPLLRRPDAKLSTLVERRFGRGASGVELVAASDRADIDTLGAPVTVAGYAIVNLAARYRLRPSLSLETRLENLFDKEYQVVEGFNTQDRAVFVTLRYRPSSTY